MSGFGRLESGDTLDTRPEDEHPPEWVALLLDGLADVLRPVTTPDTGDAGNSEQEAESEKVAEPLYADPEQWVSDWLAPLLVRQPTQEFLWCAKWWDHAEVLARITGLWEAWEAARLGGATAINDWFCFQLDHHLPSITSSSGPFFRCKPAHGDTPGEHHTPAGLAVSPTPPGFFGDSED